MFKSFFWKIWILGIFCSVFAICLVIFGFVNYYFAEEEEKIFQRNHLLVQVMTHEIESGYLKGLWPYKTLKMVSDDRDILFLWVVKQNGEVFWADDSEMLGKIIQDQFLGSEELKTRDSYFKGNKIKLIAQPIKIELKEKPWTLLLGASLESIKRAERDIILVSLYLFIPTILFIAVVAIFFSIRVTKPVKKLREGVEIIGEGNFGHKIKIKTGDEIEELANAFNSMADNLKKSYAFIKESKDILEVKVKARTRELEDLTKNLEQKVKERTADLDQRIDELEKFRKLTVGRELKMVELKKKIADLQKGLEANGTKPRK